MKKRLLTIGLLLGLCTGCADLNTTAFRSEKLITDTGTASVHMYNVYYTNAINGASVAEVQSLSAKRDQVWDASRKLGAAIAVVEATRLAYATNQNPATKAVLQSALSSLNANAGNVTNTVGTAMAPFSNLK